VRTKIERAILFSVLVVLFQVTLAAAQSGQTRLLVEVTNGPTAVTDYPVEVRVDLGEIAAKLGMQKPLRAEAVAVVDAVSGEAVPVQVDPVDSSDQIELIWLLSGKTEANTTRKFYIDIGREEHAARLPAILITPSNLCDGALWIDNGLMQLEIVPNAAPDAPCRGLIHSWIRYDENVDIAGKGYSIGTNPCWMGGPGSSDIYYGNTVPWELVSSRGGPLRIHLIFTCSYSYGDEGSKYPFADMRRDVYIYRDMPFIKDVQHWTATGPIRDLKLLIESYFGHTKAYLAENAAPDVAGTTRGQRSFLIVITGRDERGYRSFVGGSAHSGSGSWAMPRHSYPLSISLRDIRFGSFKPGQTLDYTVYQLYADRKGATSEEFGVMWKQRFQQPPRVTLLQAERRGEAPIALAPATAAEEVAPVAYASQGQPRPPAMVEPLFVARTADPQVRPVLLPQPQKVKWGQGRFSLGRAVRIIVDRDAQGRALTGPKWLTKELAQYGVQASVERTGRPERAIRIKVQPVAETHEEGYLLTVDDRGVTVTASTERGAFYGTMTLLQLIQSTSEGVSIPAVQIEDWPDLHFRGMHQSLNWIAPDMDMLHRYIEQCARWKINSIIVSLESGFRFASHPELSYEGAMTASEMSELIDYAQACFVELIPQIQSLGHCQSWLFKGGQHKDLAETPGNPYDYCPSAPGVYELMFDLYEEVYDLFKPRYFHIGHDEVRDLGVCPRCQATGLEPYELFAQDVVRLHDWWQQRGVRIMMYGDMLDPNSHGGPPHDVYKALSVLPQDIIITDWRYADYKYYSGLARARAHGFDAIGLPWYSLPNNFYYAKQAEESGCLGILGSSWALLKKTDRLVKDLSGLPFSAEYAWTVGRPAMTEVLYDQYELVRQLIDPQPEPTSESGLLFDLRPFCNCSFGGERGWLGFGPESDISALPTGRQRLGGILFDIVEPATNGGRSCLIMRGQGPFTSSVAFPRMVTIPLGAKVSALHFLNTCGWDVEVHTPVAALTFNYENDEQVKQNVEYGRSLLRWNSPHRLREWPLLWNGRTVWRGQTKAGEDIALFDFIWRNPHPDKTVTSVSIEAQGNRAAYILLSVTGELAVAPHSAAP